MIKYAETTYFKIAIYCFRAANIISLVIISKDRLL